MIELRDPGPINVERTDFFRAGALFTGDVHAAQDIQGMGLDKLVDGYGNFLQPDPCRAQSIDRDLFQEVRPHVQ